MKDSTLPSSEADALEVFLDALYLRRARGIKLGLDTTTALLEGMGNPERSFLSVHVAGTNGKGSVCAMMHRVLREAGVKAGLYTSPHLVRFAERIVIGDEPIDDRALFALLKEVDVHANHLAQRPDHRQPTFFEFVTATAFSAFARQGVEIAVLETGLGGRLDATNVVDPLLTVITSIDIDHTTFLGGTIDAIAREKAGIIKPGRPVVCGHQPEEARRIVKAIAGETNAPFAAVEDLVSVRRTRQSLEGQVLSIETQEGGYPPIRCPLLGQAQLENVAVAVAAIETLRDTVGLPIEAGAVVKGIESVRWPGRGQVLERDPVTLLDSAHNPAGARALRDLLDDILPGTPVGLVAGFSRDKNASEILKTLAPRAAQCWIVPLSVPVAMPVDQAHAAAVTAGLEVEVCKTLEDGLDAAAAWAKKHGAAVCIAGSVYLAGEVLGSRSPSQNEKNRPAE